MYLSVMNSKYGTDYFFSEDLISAQKACDKHIFELSKGKCDNRNSYSFGVYDSWVIYKTPKKDPKESLPEYLNKLMNLIHVNSHSLEKIECGGID